MATTELIKNTVDFVKKTLEKAEGGHDWFHIERVWKNTQRIALDEEVDSEVAELAALLHDIADSKFHNGDEEKGPEMAANHLISQNYPPEKIEQVVFIIRNISFRGGKEKPQNASPELLVVQDADRLDAIGAIGIARAFNYGGFKGRKLYDPEVVPNPGQSKEEYKNSTSPTLNHFYEKLLLLKDRMNTKTGRELALERHAFMESFLAQLYRETGPELAEIMQH